MQTTVTTRIQINAPRAEVFKYLLDLGSHHLWNPHLRSISPVKILEPGMKYRTTSEVLGVRVRAVNHVITIDPDKELTIENTSGALVYRINYRVSRRQDITTLTCRIAISSDSTAFAFTRPVLKMLAQRELRYDLQALKIAVEQKLRPAA